MPAEKADATKGAGEAIYKGFAKYNSAVDIINAIETKIAGIDSGATGDQTGTEIKALLEALVTKLSIETGVGETTDKKIMTATERTSLAANVAKLAGIEASAKDDQTGAEIKALLEALADKLSIETGVKETTDKKVMTADERTKLAGLPATPLENIVEDVTPQLGGNLDAQNHSINNLLGIGATPISAAQWGMLGAGVEWTAWVPTLTGGADLSGYDYARYFRIGNLCFFVFDARGRNVTTAGANIQVTLPFTSANLGRFYPFALYYDGTNWTGLALSVISPNTNYVEIYSDENVGEWAGTEANIALEIHGFFEIA